MKTAFKIIILLFFTSVSAQEQISFTMAQDVKLLTMGDTHGNSAGTLNIVITSQWQGNDTDFGYIFVAPSFEYADLEQPYRRYSANLGWTVPLFFGIDGTLSAGYGFLDHGGAFMSFGADAALSYEFIKGMHIFLNAQLTERQDLLQYGDRFRFSGFVGIKFDVFNTK